jgi:hypothetical protein
MSGFRSRLSSLEARQRRAHPPHREHFTAVVTVPPDIPAEAWHDWLARQPCACGRMFCDQRRIGLLIPTRCQTAEEWAARYGRHQPPPAPVSFPQAELTIVLNARLD